MSKVALSEVIQEISKFRDNIETQAKDKVTGKTFGVDMYKVMCLDDLIQHLRVKFKAAQV